MRRMAIFALLALLLIGPPTPAHAQAIECRSGWMTHQDMAGVYESWEQAMRVTIYPCGGIVVMWSNEYGTHEAVYLGAERLPNGGFIARVYQPDPYVRSLDGRNVIGVKPAEVGYIQIFTTGPFGDNIRAYRLQKMA